jgi:5'(3')-deoxyribonucleotidase
MINLKVRPFALDVLSRLKSKYEIGIFTAANENYAKQVIKKIDP